MNRFGATRGFVGRTAERSILRGGEIFLYPFVYIISNSLGVNAANLSYQKQRESRMFARTRVTRRVRLQ